MSYSVQLYSVREALSHDLPGTLRRLAALGFTRVEPYNFAELAGELGPALRENGLTAPTGHVGLLDGDQEAIFAAAKQLGIGTVIDPFVGPDRWQDAESIRSTAERLNDAARAAAAHGLRVGYHNHSWEISNSVEGATALEYFAGLLDPAVVLEVDAYWAAVGGVDPAALLERLGSRVVAVHLKDGPVTAVSAERFDPEEFGALTSRQLPAGQGDVDLPAILAACPSLEVGVIEFDDYAGDIFEGLAASLAYLESLASEASA
ncbi:sugar phosphate isomerase/epimerase family protein [Arthrobacter sp. NPDC090010]|uniref:sugar phosphate isomerase/epimerase family protein n=1 Tax=Arthrobacter sp. NPDC090010 TaxID=3363942 RepID=UPI00381FC41F